MSHDEQSEEDAIKVQRVVRTRARPTCASPTR
jgi:hypothetical protein